MRLYKDNRSLLTRLLEKTFSAHSTGEWLPRPVTFQTKSRIKHDQVQYTGQVANSRSSSTSIMGQTSRSHHHPSGEPASHPRSSRRDARGEPDNGASINDRFREINIDSPSKSIRKENDGRRITSHYVDGEGSGRHSTRTGERSTHVGGNHRSGQGSEARPTKGERPSKLGTHHENGDRGSRDHPSGSRHHGDRSGTYHDNDDRGSRDHPSGSRYHGDRSGSKHIHDAGPEGRSTRSRHHSGRSTHGHTGGLDPAGRDQTTQSRHQGGRSTHRHVDGLGPERRDQPTQSRHHGERGTHERSGTLAPQGHSQRSGQVTGESTHRHKNGPSSKDPPTESGHHGKGTHRPRDETSCPREDMETPQPIKRTQPPNDYKEIREQLFQEAFEPISLRTGTPYPCSQADIDFHQRGVFKKSDSYPFVGCRMATKEVLWQNDERRPTTPDEEAAIDRLSNIFQSVEDEWSIGPDLVIKAFSDLDLVFFGGGLRGNVTVQWKEDNFFREREAPFSVRGHCSSHNGDGSTVSVEGRCHIRLNASIIFQLAWERPGEAEPWQQMIGTLLHEMCHAYENVRSPRDKEPDDGSKGHGRLFNTRISVVHKRALRLLGMFAISAHKEFKQLHIFVPYSDMGQKDERGGTERDISRSKSHQKNERGSGVKDSSRSKPHDGVKIYEYR